MVRKQLLLILFGMIVIVCIAAFKNIMQLKKVNVFQEVCLIFVCECAFNFCNFFGRESRITKADFLLHFLALSISLKLSSEAYIIDTKNLNIVHSLIHIQNAPTLIRFSQKVF